MKGRMIHTKKFALLTINYQGLSTQEWLYTKIQSKANHLSLTAKDYQQAGGKTCDNHTTPVNLTRHTLRNPNHCGFICLRAFEKNLFCTSQQPSQAPGAELCWAAVLGDAWAPGQKSSACPPPFCQHKAAPNYLCNTEPKAKPTQRFCCASVSGGIKILRFTATTPTICTHVKHWYWSNIKNHTWEEIIAELTFRFALYAVFKT